MPNPIFPDFLKDSVSYAKAQRYWDELWARVQARADAGSPWEVHWMKNPVPNGNPIFTSVSPALRKGVRIIQEAPSDADDLDLDWWIDDFGGDQNDRDAIQELVIACCPSVENAPQIEQLLIKWLQPGELRRANGELRTG